MVFGLFKKASKEDINKQAAKPTQQQNQEIELEKQRKIVQMHKTLEEIKQSMDKGYKQLDLKQEKIKELIRQKKKSEAKRSLILLKALQDELAKLENMSVLLEKQIIQVETADSTSQVIHALKTASTF